MNELRGPWERAQGRRETPGALEEGSLSTGANPQLQLKPQGGLGWAAGDERGTCCPCMLWFNPCSVCGGRLGFCCVSVSCSVSTVTQSLLLFSWTHVQVLAIPRTAARQAFLSFTVSWGLLKFMSIESVMPSNHLIFCRPLLLLLSICPSIKVFSNELALCIRWSKTRCTFLELQLELEAIFSDFRATAVSVRSGSQHPSIQQLY